MSYFEFNVDPREAAYGRLVSGVMGVLRAAVAKRVGEGRKQSEIASEADLSAGHLSRVLNGNVPNITLRTVSDILWATKFDPQDFEADPIEDLSHNNDPVLFAPGLSSHKATLSSPRSSGATVNLTPKQGVRPTAVAS